MFAECQLRIGVDEQDSSYAAVPASRGTDPYANVTRRELRELQSKERTSTAVRRSAWRKGAAVAVALGLAAGTYGFVSTTSGEQHFASLTAAAEDESAPEPVRTGSVSRSVDRFPLDDATQRTITVVVDGEEQEITTRARTLAEALADAEIEVSAHDEVSAPMNGEPVDATITRVSHSIEVVEEEIPFSTTRRETDSLTKGTEKVETKGQSGERTTTKRVLTKGGEVIGEEILAEAVGAEPVDEVVLVGTKPEPAPVTASESSDGSSSGGSSGTTHSGESPRGIAQGMLSSHGWGDDQWSCLNNLWQRESGWNPSASNPSSGAYGIPQALPGSKMASAGSDWRTNPATQIKWGLGYIKGRYGSPCGAWAHSQSVGWY